MFRDYVDYDVSIDPCTRGWEVFNVTTGKVQAVLPFRWMAKLMTNAINSRFPWSTASMVATLFALVAALLWLSEARGI